MVKRGGWEWKPVKPTPCRQCGKDFIRYGNTRIKAYCSRPCYNAAVAPRPALIEVACTNCGTTFIRTRGAVARVKTPFCSRTCQGAFLQGAAHPGWRGGEAHWRGRTWTNELRELIRDRDGRRCRRCGVSEDENGRRLDVDHVLPFRSFDGDFHTANDPENLIALCMGCHRRKARAERLWLQGDVLELQRFREATATPWVRA
jgi:endogenous inhibitor of DNA gyrase (YacG/DUF329 family)